MKGLILVVAVGIPLVYAIRYIIPMPDVVLCLVGLGIGGLCSIIGDRI